MLHWHVPPPQFHSLCESAASTVTRARSLRKSATITQTVLTKSSNVSLIMIKQEKTFSASPGSMGIDDEYEQTGRGRRAKDTVEIIALWKAEEGNQIKKTRKGYGGRERILWGNKRRGRGVKFKGRWPEMRENLLFHSFACGMMLRWPWERQQRTQEDPAPCEAGLSGLPGDSTHTQLLPQQSPCALLLKTACLLHQQRLQMEKDTNTTTAKQAERAWLWLTPFWLLQYENPQS